MADGVHMSLATASLGWRGAGSEIPGAGGGVGVSAVTAAGDRPPCDTGDGLL